MVNSEPWANTGPRYFIADNVEEYETTNVPVRRVIPADENSNDDIWYINTVRVDADDYIGHESNRFGRTGKPFVPTSAYSRRCLSATVSARQRDIDSAKVVDFYDGT